MYPLTRNRLLAIAAASALVCALCAVGMAKEDMKEKAKEDQTTYREHDQMGAKGSFTPKLLNANALIGADVTNPQNEDLGEIEDVVLNARRDGISYVALRRGAVLGMGGKLHAVPWQALTVSCTARDKIEKVTLNTSKADLESSQPFDSDRWPNQGNARWSTGVQHEGRTMYEGDKPLRDTQHMQDQPQYGQPGYQQPVEPRYQEGKEMPRDSHYEQRAGMESDTMGGIEYRRLTKIVGLPVKNLENRELGDIEDVVLDLREGRPVYAVIGFGGFLGLGEKEASVPWSAVDILPQLETARIDTDREVLEAVAYEHGESPDLAQMDRAERLHQRFDEEPYWQVFGYTEPSEGAERTPSKDSWKAGSEYNANFKASTIVTKKGTIESVGTFTPASKATAGLRLRIKTDEGEMATVYAGPRNFSAGKGVQFNYGDRIEVTGSKTKVGGRSVIMATKIKHGDKTLELRSDQGEPKWQD